MQKPLSLFIPLVLLLLPSQALAAATDLPTQANPGLLIPTHPTPVSKDASTAMPMEVELELPTPKKLPVQGEFRLMVRQIIVEGNTVLSDDEMRPVLTTYLGREDSIAELGDMTDKLTKLYAAKGYLTTQVFVPEQEIENGILRVRVLEGRIGSVEVEGNRFLRTWALSRQFELDQRKPLNLNDFTAQMSRVNRFMDITMKAMVSPGAEPGTTNIRLQVKERQPWQISGTYDNQGRPFLGYYRYGIGLDNSNLTGIGDRLSVRGLSTTTGGIKAIATSYAVPLSASGTNLAFSFGYSHVDLDLGIRNQPPLTGNAYSYSVLLSQPLDRNRIWTLDGGMNIKRITSYFDKDLTNADQIFSFQHGLTFDKYDRYGRIIFHTQNTYAPRQLFNSSVSFFKNETSLIRLQVLPKNNLLIFRGNMQFTPDALPGAEEIQIGGQSSVRGYTEGLLVGDRGYNFTLEHRWPIPFLRGVSPWLADRIQGKTFVDYGKVMLDPSNTHYIKGFSTLKENTTLLSAGVGFQAQFTRFVGGFVDFGFALLNRNGPEPYSMPASRIHFGLRTNILPNNYKIRETAVRKLK
ncbi:MAG: outer membrane protein [Vampirovibrio sp.]|jgi:hemolysin activation/secretion protein|nr:outer membrane protein [Vampirovibrio sp.]